MNYKAIRGTKDILPPESCLWQEMEAACRGVFSRFGYREIRTPIIEETDLFIKSVGEDTDIVRKEMFSFVDRGERNISLRPEGTASIVRAYLENNLHKTEPFQKLYYMGPMFRAERPQAGRLRQFHQIGAEAIGANDPAVDAEIISLLTKLLEACGIGNYQLKLNNLGCREDKNKLAALLKKLFSAKTAANRLCEDCKRRLDSNPLRILDCKNEGCRALVREEVKAHDFLCSDCSARFNETLNLLNLLKIPYLPDPYIVRGLDYYTGTVFEVVHEELGSQNAIGAGGRYDNLISDMGGPKLGACGFALGTDRMVMLRCKKEKTAQQKPMEGASIFIATLGKSAREKGFLLLDELRTKGVRCDIDYDVRSLKSQMRRADSLGAGFVLIIGDDEMAKGEAVLKNMKSAEQSNIKFEDLAQKVEEIL